MFTSGAISGSATNFAACMENPEVAGSSEAEKDVAESNNTVMGLAALKNYGFIPHDGDVKLLNALNKFLVENDSNELKKIMSEVNGTEFKKKLDEFCEKHKIPIVRRRARSIGYDGYFSTKGIAIKKKGKEDLPVPDAKVIAAYIEILKEDKNYKEINRILADFFCGVYFNEPLTLNEKLNKEYELGLEDFKRIIKNKFLRCCKEGDVTDGYKKKIDRFLDLCCNSLEKEVREPYKLPNAPIIKLGDKLPQTVMRFDDFFDALGNNKAILANLWKLDEFDDDAMSVFSTLFSFSPLGYSESFYKNFALLLKNESDSNNLKALVNMFKLFRKCNPCEASENVIRWFKGVLSLAEKGKDGSRICDGLCELLNKDDTTRQKAFEELKIVLDSLSRVESISLEGLKKWGIIPQGGDNRLFEAFTELLLKNDGSKFDKIGKEAGDRYNSSIELKEFFLGLYRKLEADDALDWGVPSSGPFYRLIAAYIEILKEDNNYKEIEKIVERFYMNRDIECNLDLESFKRIIKKKFLRCCKEGDVTDGYKKKIDRFLDLCCNSLESCDTLKSLVKEFCGRLGFYTELFDIFFDALGDNKAVVAKLWELDEFNDDAMSGFSKLFSFPFGSLKDNHKRLALLFNNESVSKNPKLLVNMFKLFNKEISEDMIHGFLRLLHFAESGKYGKDICDRLCMLLLNDKDGTICEKTFRGLMHVLAYSTRSEYYNKYYFNTIAAWLKNVGPEEKKVMVNLLEKICDIKEPPYLQEDDHYVYFSTPEGSEYPENLEEPEILGGLFAIPESAKPTQSDENKDKGKEEYKYKSKFSCLVDNFVSTLSWLYVDEEDETIKLFKNAMKDKSFIPHEFVQYLEETDTEKFSPENFPGFKDFVKNCEKYEEEEEEEKEKDGPLSPLDEYYDNFYY